MSKEDIHLHYKYQWVNHYTLTEQCQIFNCKGSEDLIITTEKKIFNYNLDENQIPVLKSVIFNFMGCSTFIQSINKEIYISYSNGLEDFVVYSRKNSHGFRVPIDYKAHGYNTAEALHHANAYMVSDGNDITIY